MDLQDDKNICELYLQSLGNIVPLNIFYDNPCHQELLTDKSLDWRPYNKAKANNNRCGLSLTSLNGESDGLIDLNSLVEYNRDHGTEYTEMSFRTPTQYWDQLSVLTEPIAMFKPHLGRTHLLRLGSGGFFPPHRDTGDSFRLISFLHTSSMECFFLVDDQKVFFEPNRYYYVNTRLVHTLFSFIDHAYIMVLNVEPNPRSVKLVYDSLESR